MVRTPASAIVSTAAGVTSGSVPANSRVNRYRDSHVPTPAYGELSTTGCSGAGGATGSGGAEGSDGARVASAVGRSPRGPATGSAPTQARSTVRGRRASSTTPTRSPDRRLCALRPTPASWQARGPSSGPTTAGP